ncbi:MAG TPA: hypothetical protein VFU73_01615 [Actinocrinis sp.]|nr:hypothetical protein [Actinocrinis sp.]
MGGHSRHGRGPAGPGGAAEPVFDRVGYHPLYTLSTSGEAAVPGYWAGFRPAPGLGGVPRLTLQQAWDDEGGVFLFCGTDPTGEPAAFLDALNPIAPLGVRIVWIADPRAAPDTWTAHRVLARPLNASMWMVEQTTRIPFGGYALDVLGGTRLSLSISAASMNGSDAGLALVAPGGTSYVPRSRVFQLFLSGASLGALACPLDLPASAPGAKDGMDLLGVQVRYAMPDPDDPQHVAVRAVPMPILRQGTRAYTVVLRADPLFPLRPDRTALDFFTPADPPRTGAPFTATLQTVHGHPIELAPTKPEPGPLRPARFVFCYNALRADAPQATDTPRAYHLAPDGCFTLSYPNLTGVKVDPALLLGLSGGEYAELPPVTGGVMLVHFDAGRDAYADVAPSERGGSEGAPREERAAGAQGSEVAHEVLTAGATTSYLAVFAKAPAPGGLLYFAQPQTAPWYANAGSGQNLPAAVPLPAGRLAPFPAGTQQPPAALPIGAFSAVAPADARAARLVEEAALAPARRRAIGPAAQAPGASNMRVLTPQGVFADITRGSTPEQAAWRRLIVASLPGEAIRELVLTRIGPRLRAALQAPEVFFVVADPDEFMDDSSVRYGIDRNVLVELRAKGVPDAVLSALRTLPVPPGGFEDEQSFVAALPANAALYVDLILKAAGWLKASIADWLFQLSPRSWRSGPLAPTMMLVKYAGRTLEQWAERPQSWGWPQAAGDPAETAEALRRFLLDAAQAPEGSAARDFSRDVARNPAWNGVLFLNARVEAGDLPEQLAFVTAGVDPQELFAHHIGFPLTPVGSANGVALAGRTAVFGLIRYEDRAAQVPDHVPDFAFKTRLLSVRFAGSAVTELSAQVALLVNRLFGDALAIADPEHGNNLILSGGYQLQDGLPVYAFGLDGPADFELADSALGSVQVTSVALRTAVPATDAQRLAVEFSLGGSLRFQELSGFDVFGYGPQEGAPQERAPLDGWLRFTGLTVRMEFSPAEVGEQTFTVDEGHITLDPVSSRLRPGALADRFPARVTGLIAVPATAEGARRPEELGYASVLAPLEQQGLQPPWYGLLYALDLGTAGALAGGLGLSATLLAAWAPGTGGDGGGGGGGDGGDGGDAGGEDGESADGAGIVPVYLGIRFGDSPSTSVGQSIQGVLRLGFAAAEFLIVTGNQDAARRFEYLLRLNGLALSVLGLSLPPSGVDLVVFGDPDGGADAAALSAPGWYAAYGAARADEARALRSGRRVPSVDPEGVQP